MGISVGVRMGMRVGVVVEVSSRINISSTAGDFLGYLSQE